MEQLYNFYFIINLNDKYDFLSENANVIHTY